MVPETETVAAIAGREEPRHGSEVDAPPGRGVRINGHLWTVAGLVLRSAWRTVPPHSRPWSTVVEDPVTGRQPVTGHLCHPPGATALAVFIHGLGGSSESVYMAQLASAASSVGWASLRLNLRGADPKGSDLYHASLTADLHAALSDPGLSGFEVVTLVGLSLGGHVALRYAAENGDARLAAVAALSSPLDLAAGAAAIDRPILAPYRAYLLRGLRAHGVRAWKAGVLAMPPERLARVRTLREWDELTVAPRFGFAGAADYYAQASVGPRLGSLRCRALLVAAEGDPMVPPSAIRPVAEAAGSGGRRLKLQWLRRGGHLAYPRELGLGSGPGGGFSGQVLRWLIRVAKEARP